MEKDMKFKHEIFFYLEITISNVLIVKKKCRVVIFQQIIYLHSGFLMGKDKVY